MSTSVMAVCWPLQMPPTQKAVLISLADNANDHGDCWPSLSTIAMRTCFGKTAVIAAIQWLEAHGALEADRANGRHTRYRVTPDRFNLSASRTGTADEPVRQTDRLEGGQPVREANRSVSRTGPADGQNLSASRTGPVRQADTNRKEPSRTVSKSARKKEGSKSLSFTEWNDALGDEDAIPADDPIFGWSRKAKIPDDWLELAWMAFADRMTDSGKKQVGSNGWRASFRNYVRNGWLGVWCKDRTGGYALTTAGEQYRQVRDSEDSE